MKTNTCLDTFKQALLTLTLICAALAAPAQSWTNRYSPGGAFVQPSGLAVDGNGNTFVAGSPVTIKYSNAGVPLWTNLSTGAAALAVDGSNDVVVTGWAATIKYSSSGVPLWTNLSVWSFRAVAVDGSGNVFVTGSADVPGFDSDCTTIKYSSAGLPLWTNYYNGSSNRNDEIMAMAVDGNGDVIVAGRANVWDAFSDYLTIKYSSAGVPLWSRNYDGPRNAFDQANAVAVDSSGNVFVTGYSADNGNLTIDCVTIKYSSAGVPLWTRRYDGGQGTALAVDGDGNVIVTGSWSLNASAPDFMTIKYSNAGVLLWTNHYNGPDNGYDVAVASAVDTSGNVFVTGSAARADGNPDIVTIKYSNVGVALWRNRYHDAASQADYPTALALDSGGNVFVTGGSVDAGGNRSCVTIKYAAQTALPSLDIQRLANGIVLSWTDAAFGLQSAPIVSGNFTNVPGATSPYTNSISAGRQFFRLAQ